MADYYYSRDGKVKGPLPLEQIIKYVKARKLPPEVKICLAGKKEWKPLRLVAPDAANVASNAKLASMVVGGAVGLILLIMGVLWIFSASSTPTNEEADNKGGDGDGKPGVTEQIITEFSVTPKVRPLQEVKFNGELREVLIMDVEIQSPDPVQIPLTPSNVYVKAGGKKTDSYYLAPRSVDFETSFSGETEDLILGRQNMFKFKDGEVSLKIQKARKHMITLVFFDPPGSDVTLEFPAYKPWDGIVASVDPRDVGPGSDPGGTDPGGNPKDPEPETIVVGNVPEDFAFMALSKVAEGDIADITQVLSGVQSWGKAHMADPSAEEEQVALVSGDDVVTGLYGEGIRLFPENAGEEVKMWINEPFAAYRKGTLIAVFDPGKQEFRRPRDEDGVPEKIIPPPVEKAGGPAMSPDGPAMTPDGAPAMAPDGAPAMTPDGAPAMTPDGAQE